MQTAYPLDDTLPPPGMHDEYINPHGDTDTAAAAALSGRVATMATPASSPDFERLSLFLSQRVEELEAAATDARISLESSKHREAAMHRTCEGYKQLVSKLSQRRDQLSEELAAATRAVTEQGRRIEALCEENSSLRDTLDKARSATSVANAGTPLGRSAIALGIVVGSEEVLDRESALREDVHRLTEVLKQRTIALHEAFAVISMLQQGSTSHSSHHHQSSHSMRAAIDELADGMDAGSHSATLLRMRDSREGGSAARGATGVGSPFSSLSSAAAAAHGQRSFMVKQNAQLSLQVAELRRLLDEAGGPAAVGGSGLFPDRM